MTLDDESPECSQGLSYDRFSGGVLLVLLTTLSFTHTAKKSQ